MKPCSMSTELQFRGNFYDSIYPLAVALSVSRRDLAVINPGRRHRAADRFPPRHHCYNIQRRYFCRQQSPVHPSRFIARRRGFPPNGGRSDAGQEPWLSGWKKLTANHHAQLSYRPRPVAIIVRGRSLEHENYGQVFNDIAAAYACALRLANLRRPRLCRQSGRDLNAWSSTLTEIHGSSDRFLAAGIYGYEFANAAEIMPRLMAGSPTTFAAFSR